MRETFRHVFTSSEGEEVLDYLKRRCFYNTGTFPVGDPYTMVWSEGQRSVVLLILNMMKEAQDIPKEEEYEDE